MIAMETVYHNFWFLCPLLDNQTLLELAQKWLMPKGLDLRCR